MSLQTDPPICADHFIVIMCQMLMYADIDILRLFVIATVNLLLSLPVAPAMHFAMPPRKTSHPPPYARTSRSSPIRRKQLQVLGLIACSIITLIYLATRLFSSSAEKIPAGTPEVVIVTLLDDATMSDEYRERIMENRRYYASKQGMDPPKNFKAPNAEVL